MFFLSYLKNIVCVGGGAPEGRNSRGEGIRLIVDQTSFRANVFVAKSGWALGREKNCGKFHGFTLTSPGRRGEYFVVGKEKFFVREGDGICEEREREEIKGGGKGVVG